jgi:hypothetical protein
MGSGPAGLYICVALACTGWVRNGLNVTGVKPCGGAWHFRILNAWGSQETRGLLLSSLSVESLYDP